MTFPQILADIRKRAFSEHDKSVFQNLCWIKFQVIKIQPSKKKA